jgi:hypothetical protein
LLDYTEKVDSLYLLAHPKQPEGINQINQVPNMSPMMSINQPYVHQATPMLTNPGLNPMLNPGMSPIGMMSPGLMMGTGGLVSNPTPTGGLKQI